MIMQAGYSSLPELLEIVPLGHPVSATITVPGSKSITNRALILAALSAGEVELHGALWSEDTQVMVDCLRELGYMINVHPDAAEAANRKIVVYGQQKRVPPGGSVEQPLELFVGNAGTTARFLTAMLCLGRGVYRLHGTSRMHERPQRELFDALRQLGYKIDSPNGRLPAIIHGGGPLSGKCRVSIRESSQFASALLLCADAGGWMVEVDDDNAEESPYVLMTRQLVAAFPHHGGSFRIEPDASSGSYFWAAGELLRRRFGKAGLIKVAHWPESGWQIDADFPKYLPLPPTLSRAKHLGDSIMTAIILGPGAGGKVTFTDLGRLRLQECERVAALRSELAKCGAQVIEEGDTLEIFPGELHGAEIETYNDHRMAMCFATLGLQVPGIKIKNPACVSKTFPNFFHKLAAPPPGGLGVELRNGRTGEKLKLC